MGREHQARQTAAEPAGRRASARTRAGPRTRRDRAPAGAGARAAAPAARALPTAAAPARASSAACAGPCAPRAAHRNSGRRRTRAPPPPRADRPGTKRTRQGGQRARAPRRPQPIEHRRDGAQRRDSPGSSCHCRASARASAPAVLISAPLLAASRPRARCSRTMPPSPSAPIPTPIRISHSPKPAPDQRERHPDDERRGRHRAVGDQPRAASRPATRVERPQRQAGCDRSPPTPSPGITNWIASRLGTLPARRSTAPSHAPHASSQIAARFTPALRPRGQRAGHRGVLLGRLAQVEQRRVGADRRQRGEVVAWRRRAGGPLERVTLPRVVAGRDAGGAARSRRSRGTRAPRARSRTRRPSPASFSGCQPLERG